MDRLAVLFSLAPVSRGFLAMAISGFSFPICGLMVLRMNLVMMRYMLMHGVILGGALSLAMNLPVVPVSFGVNLLLILTMIFFNKNNTVDFSGGSAASMILSIAFSSLIMHIKDVPAKDTLNLLWGSPFALKNSDVMILAAISLLLIVYVILNYRNILALFFNVDVAKSLGINFRLHYFGMVGVIAIIVAVAMKLLGAFLIDALLILPVLAASSFESKKSGGIKKTMILSSGFGLSFAVVGYVIAVLADWPPAATISILAGLVYGIGVLKRRFFA